jgi:hypothetical protein
MAKTNRTMNNIPIFIGIDVILPWQMAARPLQNGGCGAGKGSKNWVGNNCGRLCLQERWAKKLGDFIEIGCKWINPFNLETFLKNISSLYDRICKWRTFINLSNKWNLSKNLNNRLFFDKSQAKLFGILTELKLL